MLLEAPTARRPARCRRHAIVRATPRSCVARRFGPRVSPAKVASDAVYRLDATRWSRLTREAEDSRRQTAATARVRKFSTGAVRRATSASSKRCWRKLSGNASRGEARLWTFRRTEIFVELTRYATQVTGRELPGLWSVVSRLQLQYPSCVVAKDLRPGPRRADSIEPYNSNCGTSWPGARKSVPNINRSARRIRNSRPKSAIARDGIGATARRKITVDVRDSSPSGGQSLPPGVTGPFG